MYDFARLDYKRNASTSQFQLSSPLPQKTYVVYIEHKTKSNWNYDGWVFECVLAKTLVKYKTHPFGPCTAYIYFIDSHPSIAYAKSKFARLSISHRAVCERSAYLICHHITQTTRSSYMKNKEPWCFIRDD